MIWTKSIALHTTVAAALVASVTVALALGVASSGLAARAVQPVIQDLPTISGKAEVGQTLTATTGRWSNNPTEYAYDWRRCDQNGGSCSSISGSNTKDYVLKSVDKDNTLRVVVTARNSDGAATATSVPTSVVGASSSTTGCGQQSTVPIQELAPPERLMIDRQNIQPPVVGRGTPSLNVRFHVSACNGKPVQGALVYVTAAPYRQFSVPPEVETGSDGWAQLEMRRLEGFPATRRQQLLVMFVRARKAGENPLAGISTRRLVSFRVDLRQ